MFNILKYYSVICRNLIFSIAIYIIICICIIIIANYTGYRYSPPSHKALSPLIDITENQWKVSCSQIGYTTTGQLLISEMLDNKNTYEIYDPQQDTLSPVDHLTDADILQYSAPERKYRIMAGGYQYNGNTLDEKLIPTETENGIVIWCYNDNDQTLTGYLDKQIVGHYGINGFAANSADAGRFSMNEKYFWAIKDQNNKRHMLMLSCDGKSIYQTDFSTRERIQLTPASLTSKIIDWQIFTADNVKKESIHVPDRLFVVYNDISPAFVKLTNTQPIITHIALDNIDYSQQAYNLYTDINRKNIYINTIEDPRFKCGITPQESDELIIKYITNKELGRTTNIVSKNPHRLYKLSGDLRSAQLIHQYNKLWTRRSPANIQPYFFATIPGYLILPINSHNLPGTVLPFWTLWYLRAASVICVFIMLAHTRNRQRSIIKTAGWAILIYSFNIAGLATYLIFNHYPLTICHNCGKSRWLNKNQCPHCKSNLPTPTPSTTNIITIP